MSFLKNMKIFLIFLSICGSALSDGGGCKDTESAILCHGSRLIRNVVKSLHYNQNSKSPITLVPGLEIVSVPAESRNYSSDDSDDTHFNGRSNDIDEDDSIIGHVTKYLQSHEVKIKFADLLDKTDFKEVLMSTLNGIDEGKDIVEGRKRDKNMGMMMMMGLMMGKMMTALGLGAVGALALKALGVSMMALMLAAIIGIKKLADSGQGGGGHSVSYVTAHEGHRRKRREIEEDTPLPYRGWTHLSTNN